MYTTRMPEWKEFMEWFWEKTQIPLKKSADDYFEIYNDIVRIEFIDYLYETYNCANNPVALEKLDDLEQHLKGIMKKHTEIIKNQMYKEWQDNYH